MESTTGDKDKGLFGHVRKSTPPPFLMKTYTLVENPATDDVISWNGDGTGFVVWHPAELARDLLPTLFKHSNFSSFVRQLNTYGFRKVATSRWEFCNEMFRKGEREMLRNIHRRRAWANRQQPPDAGPMQVTQECDEEQRSSSTSSSSEYNSLMDENKRLRQENGVLSSELTNMKRKCRELLELTVKYSQYGREEEDERPKLFGVRLEVGGDKVREGKKKKDEIGESASLLLSQSCI